MPTALDAVDSDTSMPLALRLLDGVKETEHTAVHTTSTPLFYRDAIDAKP